MDCTRGPNDSKMKTDTVMTRAPTVEGGTTKGAGSTAARVATHVVAIAAVKHDTSTRNTSITSGVMKRTATTEELGHIGSARSSSTAGAEG